MTRPVIVWFGDDLRLDDHEALLAAGDRPALFVYVYGETERKLGGAAKWWLGRSLSAAKEITWIAAMGQGGQRIFVVPELDLVVMMTSGLYFSGRQGHAEIDILSNFVISSVRDK